MPRPDDALEDGLQQAVDHQLASVDVCPLCLSKFIASHDMTCQTDDDDMPRLDHDSQYDREATSSDSSVYEPDGDDLTCDLDTQRANM